MTGVVKRYIEARGFGFIRPDGSELPSEEVFVHIRAFRNGGGEPKAGVRVEYDVGLDKEGRSRAENVRILEE